MKKFIIALLSLVMVLSLAACDFSGQSKKEESKTDAYKNHKKILALAEEYSAEKGYGFDYAMEQKYADEVVGKHSVSVRLNGDAGSRVEYTKEMNKDFSQDMYTEKQATAYYKAGKIATYAEDAWVWKDCTLSEFASVKLSESDFDIDTLLDINLTADADGAVLTFGIADTKAASFLGISGTVKDLRFEIASDASYTALTSFKMSYTQSATTTEFKLVPYSEATEIDIPVE